MVKLERDYSLFEAELIELAKELRSGDCDAISQAVAFVNGLVIGCRVNNDKLGLFGLSSFIRAFPDAFDAYDLARLRCHAVIIEGKELAALDDKVGA